MSPQDDHPAISLLEDVTSLEGQLLQKLNPKQNVGNLKLAQWEDIGQAVYVPGWRKYVGEYAELLAGVTAGSLPEKVKDLSEMGSHIRDPKGMLLKREQRAQRAADLLAAGFCLALLASGWELHAQPGEVYLQRGTEQLHPFHILRELASAKLTGQAWLERIQALGIEYLCLDPSKAPDAPRGITV